MRGRLVVIVSLALLAVPVGGAVSAPAATPRIVTLVKTSTPIRAVAQDGVRIAWASGAPCAKVKLRAVAGGSATVLGDTSSAWGCLNPQVLAVAGTRAVWGGVSSCCRDGLGEITLGVAGQPAQRLRPLRMDRHAWGDFLVGAGSDGQTLAVAMTSIGLTDGTRPDDSRSFLHCLPHDPCTWTIKNGATWIVDGAALRYFDAPPPALIAVAAGRVAIVPADRGIFAGSCAKKDRSDCPHPHAPIDATGRVKDPVSGETIAFFQPKGEVVGLALDPASAAVIVRSGTATRIERYDASTGALLTSKTLAAGNATDLGISGAAIVYRSGRTIHLLDSTTGKDAVLVRARTTPFGLSIEGQRVLWAENTGKRGVIRTLVLPPG